MPPAGRGTPPAAPRPPSSSHSIGTGSWNAGSSGQSEKTAEPSALRSGRTKMLAMVQRLASPVWKTDRRSDGPVRADPIPGRQADAGDEPGLTSPAVGRDRVVRGHLGDEARVGGVVAGHERKTGDRCSTQRHRLDPDGAARGVGHDDVLTERHRRMSGEEAGRLVDGRAQTENLWITMPSGSRRVGSRRRQRCAHQAETRLVDAPVGPHGPRQREVEVGESIVRPDPLEHLQGRHLRKRVQVLGEEHTLLGRKGERGAVSGQAVAEIDRDAERQGLVAHDLRPCRQTLGLLEDMRHPNLEAPADVVQSGGARVLLQIEIARDPQRLGDQLPSRGAPHAADVAGRAGRLEDEHVRPRPRTGRGCRNTPSRQQSAPSRQSSHVSPSTRRLSEPVYHSYVHFAAARSPSATTSSTK